MITKFKKFNEGINHILVGPTNDEILDKIGADKMLLKMIDQNNIDGINYAIEHGADEKVYLTHKSMLDLVGKKVFCVRLWTMSFTVNCSIFTNENVSGFGCGLFGDYFNIYDFNNAFIDKTGDSCKRYLYTLEELPLMYKKFGLNNNTTIELIKKYRKSMRQDVYEDEKKSEYFVPIEDIFK